VVATRAPRTIDLAALIDGRKLTPFNYVLIALSTLITLFDGLDMFMVSYTAPYMRDELGLTNGQLGNVFSSGTVGMVIGGLAFTYVGDRIGRRPTIVFAGLAFGVLTLATGFATTYPMLLLLRFFDGLAIGGMLPLAWALNIEFLPKKVRATAIAFVMMGFSFGSASAGPLTNWIAPVHGWEGVYFFGGGATLLCAIIIAIWLPESPRFLVTKALNPALTVKTLKRLDSTIDVEPGDTIILGDEGVRKGGLKLSDLFEGRLKWVTPLMWLGYGFSALGIFFKSTWGPIILEAMDVSRVTAANVSALSGLLGAVAGVLLMKFAERWGLLLVAFCTALIVPMALLIGFEVIHGPLFLPIIVVQSMLVGACHTAIISQLSIFYPTAIRASAGGCASAVGKVGGIIGPLIAPLLLDTGMPAVRTYAVAAACPAILVVCIIAIYNIMRKPEPEPELRGVVAPAE
jgi:AAHS family 4-hydroxybenzoate transporter-like MFS transporter